MNRHDNVLCEIQTSRKQSPQSYKGSQCQIITFSHLHFDTWLSYTEHQLPRLKQFMKNDAVQKNLQITKVTHACSQPYWSCQYRDLSNWWRLFNSMDHCPLSRWINQGLFNNCNVYDFFFSFSNYPHMIFCICYFSNLCYLFIGKKSHLGNLWSMEENKI